MVFHALYKNDGIAFFRFVANHAFDRRTEGQTDSIIVTRVTRPPAFNAAR